LENWLATRLNPRIDFEVYEFDYDVNRHISLFVIPATKIQPVAFLHQAYIRVGSITRKLNDFPEKQAKIWKKEHIPFEKEIAKNNLVASDITKYLSAETYFDLMKLPYPSEQQGVIEKLIEEGLVVKNKGYAITKLGALLFAKNLNDFESIGRKSARVIIYKGKNKIETEREQIVTKGYAIGFVGLVGWINSQLPANEEIGKALRTESRMYPEIAIRELVANALIHQDLTEKGFPMMEIFTDRIEISNPGTPLVSPERFIDAYKSRNDKLADLMRRMGFCEEKGSGLDKVIFCNELYQLPPINVAVAEDRTKVTLYSYKALNELDKKEKIRACYQHACLKWVSNEKMTNQSLRERFKIEEQNAAIASRIIRDTLSDKLIKEEDPENKSRKYASYLPYWA
jgi:predicted HTH transcriptional regulator